ncbi:hypothetical protein RSOL_445860, partial [Rhizoctonia solani AG-3 Rhs1AP]
MNAASLFDRNPLHVAHLQGPVDRLHDTNLRAIYERAGKILLIQRWKDLSTAAPHAFLLFESETAANSCCNRIGAPRITTPNNSHPLSITASILQPNQPNHPALQQWLCSQNMVPSYVIKNPPAPSKAAAFPLLCLRVLNEDASDVVGKLKEFKCGPGWWRFVAQMYVANKLWAAARMVLKCEKEPDDDVIDISDDSTHEHVSDDDQSGPKSSKKTSHNAWLPSKRDVSGARAKLGVVTSKPGAAAKTGAKAAKSASEAPPFVPTPMSESPTTDTEPQASSDTPPTVPATLPKSTAECDSGINTYATLIFHSKIIAPHSDSTSCEIATFPTKKHNLPSKSDSTPAFPIDESTVPPLRSHSGGSQGHWSESDELTRRNKIYYYCSDEIEIHHSAHRSPGEYSQGVCGLKIGHLQVNHTKDIHTPDENKSDMGYRLWTKGASDGSEIAQPPSQVKKEAEQETLASQPSGSRGSSIISISPAQDSPAQKAPSTRDTPATQEPSTTVTRPTTQSEDVPMEEDSFSTPTEGDSSFGVPIEDLFSISIAPTEDTSSVIPSRDLPSVTCTQAPSTAPTQDSASALPASTAMSSTPTPHRVPARTPIRSPSREPLSFFGISSSPSSLLVALPPTSSSPTKRKSDTFETRMIKRRRHRTSSSKSEPIIVEPEMSALEAEKARAAELQAEEDRVRELLGVDMSDYAESVMARLSGSDKASSRGIISGSDKSKSSPAQETTSVESDLDMELRSLRATRDENEALKMKIKVLELTLPTAESVKNELYAERKEKSQLMEALEIERSLLTQSEALRKQSDATREGLQQRIKQLEERLSESAGALEKAREAAQTASEQRRKAEEASSAAEVERTKLGALLDAERDLVSRERASLAEESNIRAEAQAKLAATEARLASEQRRYAEAMDQASKERIEAKNFLDAEKAIVSAQEAKLEREKEIRGELEAKLREVEDKLKEEQVKRIEDKKSADHFLQNELTMAMKLVTAEREITKSERVKTTAEMEARGLAEKELVLLKEQFAACTKALKEALDTHTSMQRDLTTFKDQLNESERREGMLRVQLSTAGSKIAMTEGRARAGEDRATEAELVSKRHLFELTRLQAEFASEKKVLMMERQALAKERIARKDLEGKSAVLEEKLAAGAKQTSELQAQLQAATSSSQGTKEQLQTQRTLLHIARTRIQELEQAIQRVENDLDAARTAEATAKTMVQLWGPPRAQLSSPISDIVEQPTETEIDPFIPLMKPHRQQSFKLKRTAAPARLLQVDMPSGEPANIDLGGLPANPETIIDLLYRSKCAGVFWDIIMDEYGAMGCFDAAEAIAEGKLKYQP